MQIDMDRFRATFFEEAAEHVLTMESALLAMEDSLGNRDLLDTIFRSAHSIKGASGTFGFDDVSHFTHSLENLLDKMRAGAIDCSPERLDLLLRSLDVLRGLLASARGEPGLPPGVEQVLAELRGILGQEAKPATAPVENAGRPASLVQRTYRVAFVPDRDILRQGMDPLLLLRDLSQIGTILETKADLSRLPSISELDPESCHLGWSLRLATAQTPEQIAEVFAFVEDSSQVSIEAQIDNQDGTTDRAATLGAEVDEPAGRWSVPSHVPLAMAVDLIHMATELVYAQASLLHAANTVLQAAQDKAGDCQVKPVEAETAIDRVSEAEGRGQDAMAGTPSEVTVHGPPGTGSFFGPSRPKNVPVSSRPEGDSPIFAALPRKLGQSPCE